MAAGSAAAGRVHSWLATQPCTRLIPRLQVLEGYMFLGNVAQVGSAAGCTRHSGAGWAALCATVGAAGYLVPAADAVAAGVAGRAAATDEPSL